MRRVIATAMTAVFLLGLAGCERFALDRQMEELCKKDGGIKVYETATLPASEFSSTGQPLAKYIPLAKSEADYLGPEYKYVQQRKIIVGQGADIQEGEGQLSQWYSAVYRRSDGLLLGESISYGRGGGDGFTFGFQPSGNYCPKPRIDLIKAIFIKGE